MTITTDLASWRAAVQRHPDTEDRTTAELMRDADLRELEAIRARQAANRGLVYTRRRPTRYAAASYSQLRPEQDPRGRVSSWLNRGPRALVLAGPSRTGKTTAAYAIANDAHQRGTWVMPSTAGDLSAALKPDGEPQAFEHASTCDLLLLDDLGRERVTEWWLEQLQRIIDDRCANERRLIVTTNVAGANAEQAYTELAGRYGDPLTERLIDGGGVIVLDGPPVRQVVAEW